MTDYEAVQICEGLQESDRDQQLEAWQHLINTGTAWTLQGTFGRTAMSLIESGQCVLGEQGHRDAYGNYVPSRTEVESGTKGSVEYANELTG